MSIHRNRPYAGFNFLVELGGEDARGANAAFSEVILPEAWVEVVEYRPGNMAGNNALKLTGPEHNTNLILRRGVNGSLDLYQWWDAVRNGVPGVERNVVISLHSEDRAGAVVTWKFINARPVKYSFSPLNGLETGPVTETIELAFERMQME
jgi:phage tail-like protein